MYYSTHTIFVHAAQILNSNLIMDLGCLDAKDTMTFNMEFPQATIIGFEANPNNYEKLAGRKDILENNIQIHNLAVSDQTRIIEFYLYNPPDY